MRPGRRVGWCMLVAGLSSALVPLTSLALGALAASAGSAACSSSPMVVAVSPDGGGSAVVSDGEGGSIADASTDTTSATTDAPATACEGTCKITSLVGDFGGKKRTLVRAQFGTQPGDGGTELHTESHLGGDPACPTMSSPSPDYTLIVTSIPRGATGKKLSQNDGIKAVFFDFKADLGLAAPSGISKSLSVNITVVAEDPATPPAWVAVDVTAGFTEGSVAGHLYAEYCQSLTQ
jgi:hypothetical protein